MTRELETVELGPSAARCSIIWLHGLGADGHDFEPLAPQLRLEHLDVRFVFPHAPVRPVTLNGGYPMRAWFDLAGIERDGPLDRDGLLAAMAAVEALIAREQERGVEAGNIVLAGFSQGGALALTTALRSKTRLAGIMGLSTFLMSPQSVDLSFEAANRDTPLFMAHGRQDPIVPIELGRETRDYLAKDGFSPEWHEYDMPHAVGPEEIGDIRAFLLRILEKSD